MRTAGLLLLAFSVAASALFHPPPVYASASLVQQGSANSSGSTSSSVTLTTVTAGDVIVVAVVTGAATPMVSDSFLSTFTRAVLEVDAGSAWIFYATASQSGSDQVTVNFGTSTFNTIFVYDVSGVTTAGEASGSGSGDGCFTSPCGDSFSTSSSLAFSSGSFLLEAVFDGNGGSNFTPGTGPTTASASASTSGFAAYSSPSTSGDVAFTASLSVASGGGFPWAMAALVLDPAPPSVPEFPVAWALPVLFVAGVAMYLSASRRRRKAGDNGSRDTAYYKKRSGGTGQVP